MSDVCNRNGVVVRSCSAVVGGDVCTMDGVDDRYVVIALEVETSCPV